MGRMTEPPNLRQTKSFFFPLSTLHVGRSRDWNARATLSPQFSVCRVTLLLGPAVAGLITFREIYKRTNSSQGRVLITTILQLMRWKCIDLEDDDGADCQEIRGQEKSTRFLQGKKVKGILFYIFPSSFSLLFHFVFGNMARPRFYLIMQIHMVLYTLFLVQERGSAN